MANRYGISVPQRNIPSLQRTTAQLKEAVEALLGYRGSLFDEVEQVSTSTGIDGFQDFEAMLIAIGDLQNRVGALEQGRQTLLDRIANLEQDVLRLYDGTHAYGESSARYRWTPSNNPSNGNTRISFDTVLAQSNMDHPDDYTFSPQFEGDFAIFAYLNFEADSSGDEWRMQAYDNGGAVGRRFDFKPDEIGGGVFAQFFLQTAGFFQAGDAIDLRLWPKDSGKRGWIESFSYQMVGLGLVDPG